MYDNLVRLAMAVKNTFFIRANVEVSNAFNQSEIDLGAFVDALGNTVLRIHRVDVSIRDAALPESTIIVAASGTGQITWQLSTQSNTAMVTADQRDIISLGCLNFSNVDPVVQRPTWMNSDADLLPQEFESGYLIATEQIYLAGYASALSTPASLTVVLECSVETLTKGGAMALALSQQ
ncbi:MAG: hypothetical protein [Circular genetic element sp.]|nr:MAG: hypothetical protein [Circular genetic element sp.]